MHIVLNPVGRYKDKTEKAELADFHAVRIAGCSELTRHSQDPKRKLDYKGMMAYIT